ncbi:abc transporter c family member 10 [Quercus suber]|uniref:Abc transporter c family member 10 n=1 Tax=Quercus suber TaxID=58331 RepID=A0AAW0LTM1_QUESU
MLGTMTIRGFDEEDRFFAKHLELIDRNASPFFHIFASNEWLIQRLETLSAVVLASSALYMVNASSQNYFSHLEVFVLLEQVSHGAIQFTAYAELRKGHTSV